MELSDYIKLTLYEIAEGIRKADKKYKEKGGCVLTNTEMTINGIPHVRDCKTESRDVFKPIIKVAFHVGVEVEESEESNNKLGSSIKVISANSESLSKDGKRSVHEVSFEIPLILPKK